MNRFERWFLKRILCKQVKQGPRCHLHTIELYVMIKEAAEKEFTEDNSPTLSHYLKECFYESVIGMENE